MGWEVGKRYRVRGVSGEVRIAKTSNGKPYVEALVEVVLGPELGERLRYRGYLTTEETAGETAADLETMGCRSGQLGDWTGYGSREFSIVAMCDEGVGENQGRKYWRAAFVRDLATLRKDDKNAADSTEVDALNRRFSSHFRPRPQKSPAGEPPPGRFDDEDPDLAFPPA